MYLILRCYKGRFDIIHPTNESIRAHVDVFDDGKPIQRMAFEVTEIFDENMFDPETVADEVAGLIEQDTKRFLCCSDRREREDFCNWLREHREPISRGMWERYYSELKNERERLVKRIVEIDAALNQRQKISSTGLQPDREKGEEA